MSINGIRRIRDTKQQVNDPEQLRGQKLSEFTDSVYISTYEGVSSTMGKSDIHKGPPSSNNSQIRTNERHRKTGSVAFQTSKQKSIADFVSRELHLPLGSYGLKTRQRPPNTGSLTSRREKDVPSYRPLTRLEADEVRTFQPTVSKFSFNLEYVVGKGGFGKVWKVKEKKTGHIYAMKEMLKTKIMRKKSVHSVMNQKQLLQRLTHPFLVNMVYSFQDTETLYLVMDYVNGGDLRYHLGNRRKFTEPETKFMVSCIIAALQYLHLNNVIHRDLKPENLVFDRDGYLRLTDLGVSRQNKPNNAADTSGTPGYMAPEVICRRDHSFPVDFFALGVMAYEMMLGKRPYVGRNRAEIRDQILAKQVKVQQTPKGWSPSAVDFINKLIQRKPENRLGTKGIYELKQHQWFKGFDWSGLSKRNIKPPFIPLTIEQDYDEYKQCISEDSQLEDESQFRMLLRQPDTQTMFEGYEYKSERVRHSRG